MGLRRWAHPLRATDIDLLDDLQELTHYVEERGWLRKGPSGVLLGPLHPDDARYYFFSREDLEDLISRLEGNRGERLDDLLNVHESSASSKLWIATPTGEVEREKPNYRPDGTPYPWVVFAGERLVGVTPDPGLAYQLLRPASSRGLRPTAPFELEYALPGNADALPITTTPITIGSGRTVSGDQRRGEESRAVGAEPPSGEASDAAVVRQTPHLDVAVPETPDIGAHLVVRVWADSEALRPGETGSIAVLDDPSAITIALDVWLVTTAHFRVAGAPQGTLELQRDGSRSPDLLFDIELVGLDAPGDPVVTALFVRGGRPCGSVTRNIGDLRAANRPVATSGARVRADLAARRADITVQIVATPERDGRHFECSFYTNLMPGYDKPAPEPWILPNVSAVVVSGYMQQFVKPGASNQQRRDALVGAGRDLFSVAPEGFQKLLWSLIDRNAEIRTIFIVSSEWYVPWELMIPHRRRPGQPIEQRAPLGVEFTVGRWVHQGHEAPTQSAPLTDCWVVAPRYKGRRVLEKAEDEVKLVLEAVPGERIDPATYDKIRHALAYRGASLLHFVCHGQATADGTQIIELDPVETMSSLEIKGMKAAQDAFGEAAPVVFLNACEVGRPAPALVGSGGFAASCIELGARAVIAPLWSVKDTVAHEVAKAFYRAIERDATRPYAEVLQELRALAYADDTGEDSYAAYCFYGDPLTAGVTR